LEQYYLLLGMILLYIGIKTVITSDKISIKLIYSENPYKYRFS